MKTRFILFGMALFFCLSAAAIPPAEEGKNIFTTRCAGCHSINKNLTGPALARIDERRSIEWIINFVHSSQTLIKGGDKEAIALFEKFNKIPMPDHSDLTDDNIKNIVAYIKTETKAEASTAPFKKPEKLRPAYTPETIYTPGFFATYLALVALLVGVLLMLVNVKALQRKANGEM